MDFEVVRNSVARGFGVVLRVAKDFKTQNALDEYLKSHPGAKRTDHGVVSPAERDFQKKEQREREQDDRASAGAETRKDDEKKQEGGAPAGERGDAEPRQPQRGDPSQPEDVGEGMIVLLDQEPGSKEARVAEAFLASARMAAQWEPVRGNPNRQRRRKPGGGYAYRDKPADDQGKARDETGPAKGPAKDGAPAPAKGAPMEVRLKQVLGEDPGDGWGQHPIAEHQLTHGVQVRFPDGSSKKYGELSDDEKARVQKALADGNAATRGMNDYSKVDVETLKANMARNLGFYDSGSEEKANSDASPVTKENAKQVADSIRENAKSVLEKYSKAMSSVSRPMAEAYVDDMASAVEEAARDGSLGDVSQADVDALVREDVRRMLHQEVETRRRSLGDHGIRHATTNAANTEAMLGELQKAGLPVTGKDKLMAMTIQANHDVGYTVGDPATGFKGSHKDNSEELFNQERGRFDKVFGADSMDDMAKIIKTHDANDVDWDKDPVGSAVRLSDSTALFGQEKVQELFVRQPRTMELACKLRLAAEADPGNDQLIESIKKQMHQAVEDGDFDEVDKKLLNDQVSEMGEKGFSASKDILSRFSGRIDDFSFDKDRKVMTVGMRYSPEGQTVDMLFGDKLAAKKFNSFIEDMGGKPVEGQARGEMEFESNGKPAFRLEMRGFDDDPAETAHTEAMKGFVEKTARAGFNSAKRSIIPPPGMVEDDVDKAFEYVKKERGKFNDAEWASMEKLFKDGRGNPASIVEALGKWPLLESEKAYLGTSGAAPSGGAGDVSGKADDLMGRIKEFEGEDKDRVVKLVERLEAVKDKMMGKAASIPRHAARMLLASVATKGVFRRLAQLSDEEKAEVVKKVMEKIQGGGQEAEGDAPADAGDAKGLDAMEKEVEALEQEAAADVAPPEGGDEAPEADAPGPEEDVPEADAPAMSDDDGEGGLLKVVEDLAAEVEQIRSDGRVDPSEVLGLFDNMMQMVTFLVDTKAPAKRRRRRKSSLGVVDFEMMVGRVAASFAATRGLQVRRKDKDTMADTGGVSKGREREPELKPPREDGKKTHRTKDKPAGERDRDTDSDPDIRKD